MPKKEGLRKVMVIGSGPIIIGQAAEFDYAGTQACKALKEEGLEVVLVNSNPATIMTDDNIADRVYIEPLTWESVAKIIAKEKPDGLVPTLGGQTGLNLAVELAKKGVLRKEGVALLGTSLEAIQKAEDRELFKNLMLEIGEPIPESAVIKNVEDALEFVQKIGYPVVVRPAYTLGGSGGGIAYNEDELRTTVAKGIMYSAIGQVLLEQSVLGWKEIEYEVMRDGANNCITICNMENFDPVGVHTGDSIVVAPSQTLADKEYQMLRTASLKIIRALKIEGGCNVQLALDPHSMNYVIIEVNPRVSRSSALASKATGYPIAKMAAKIAIGMTLDEITNPVTGKTTACFEPALDYVVVKIPRWPFDKFVTADRSLGTQMKATGEVMAIDRSFEAALLKAVRSLEIGANSLRLKHSSQWTDMEIEHKLAHADDERLFVVAEAFRRYMTVREIHQLSKIDYWFLNKVKDLVEMEKTLRDNADALSPELLRQAKEIGFTDDQIGVLTGGKEGQVRNLRLSHGIAPVYKMVDTCAAEFESATPYYYSTYDQEDEVEVSDRKKVLVLGSGPIRIGQGIEFDYCSVHSVWGLKEEGVESIIINNNPETVSTDFDTADKLYFEPLTVEDVMNVIDKEKPYGVVVQFGGQTAINLAGDLHQLGINILGTPVESIDAAEDREKFEKLLKSLNIPQTEGKTAFAVEEAKNIAEGLGYPVLVRPSYVLGGRAMEIVHNTEELLKYMETAVQVTPKHPVLVDKYVRGKEVEVDAIGDGENILIPGIMEHIERAGVHSGDSIAVYPPQTLSQSELDQVVDYTTRVCKALKVKGLLNIQYVVGEGQVYVLEVNPRASRTVPILSKVTGVPMVKVATKAMLGKTLVQQGYPTGLWVAPEYVTVKAPVFSFEKLTLVDTSLGPEMKSTGEVMGVDRNFDDALYKALLSAGFRLPTGGSVLVSIADKDKEEAVPIVAEYARLGFKIYATGETAVALNASGVAAQEVVVADDGSCEAINLIRSGEIKLTINTPTKGKNPGRVGFKIRRAASEFKVPCLTSLDTANAIIGIIRFLQQGRVPTAVSLDEFVIKQSLVVGFGGGMA